MINTIPHRDNLYEWLVRQDVLAIMRPGIQDKQQYNVPWVYTQMDHEAKCHHYHKMHFETLQKIHTHCRSCWKVVIRPQNIVQLFDLYEWQRSLGVACKCGYEAREMVFGLWGGYFYTRSIDAGLERYRQVFQWANEALGPEVANTVILKRYCTEFELGPGNLGPSDELPPPTEEEMCQEEKVDHMLPHEAPGYEYQQPNYMVAHVMRRWFHWAHSGGDGSYVKLNGGQKLFKPYATYHNRSPEQIEELKKKLY